MSLIDNESQNVNAVTVLMNLFWIERNLVSSSVGISTGAYPVHRQTLDIIQLEAAGASSSR